ncbi:MULTISPECIES: PIN domain-containing protein [unclassified Avibacterium]|uniref:PIN domain-containing protein n=1 Tax=unclassified Avibacterium TaxID=2685287 RepID=UPI00218C767E|nr:PIN domain-containing protein [Avibacterium sp. 21-599]MCW9717144.1 PIN domain-containing protein [Avibacterium sp. 21-599]URL01505.1 PIN domain-containing protein [Avibacterium sp. 20-126]
MKLIFIDYENIQPTTLEHLSPNDHFIVLCIGENQKSLPVTLVTSLIRFEKNCRIIECPKSGKNALDFIIVDEMARITTEYQFNSLYIISKDKGFDSIIHYYLIKDRIKQAKRLDSINDILSNPNPRDNSQTKNMVEFASTIQKHIDKINAISPRSLPKKPQSQYNCINALLKSENLAEKEIKALIKMVDFSPAQSTELKIYIARAKAKLNSLEKRHHPNKLETQTNWLKSFFNGDGLNASQISKIREMIFTT